MSSFPKQVSLHGQRAYVSPDDKLVAKSAFVAGGERSHGNKGGSIVLPGSPDTVAIFDDFLGDLIADEWNVVESDTGHAQALVAGTGGVYRLTVSSTAAKTQAGATGLNGGAIAQWKANQGNLRMAARVKFTPNGGNNIFIGLTDTGLAGTTQTPIHDTGATAGVISTATNAVGFVYGGNAATATGWAGVGVSAGTGRTPVTGAAPAANVYDVLEVRIGDTGGNGDGDKAYFYRNGTLIGSMANPVASTVGLTPCIAAWAQDTGYDIDIDYINVSANRDTGI
jgi:hypothetical protein